MRTQNPVYSNVLFKPVLYEVFNFGLQKPIKPFKGSINNQKLNKNQ